MAFGHVLREQLWQEFLGGADVGNPRLAL